MLHCCNVLGIEDESVKGHVVLIHLLASDQFFALYEQAFAFSLVLFTRFDLEMNVRMSLRGLFNAARRSGLNGGEVTRAFGL